MQFQASHNLTQFSVITIFGLPDVWDQSKIRINETTQNTSDTPVFGVAVQPERSWLSILSWGSSTEYRSNSANVSNGTLSFMVLPDQVMEA
eukprot:2371720-Rhodomonas_salina.1